MIDQRMWNERSRAVLLICLASWGATVAACRRPVAPPAEESAPPQAKSVTVRVLVVNDPELADAVELLRGEWAAVSKSTLAVHRQPMAELLKNDPPDADVIIFPSRYMGELCERGRLRPVRRSVLASDVYDATDVFPLVRHRLMAYGRRAMALPLGEQIPLLCFRTDVLESLDSEAPRTWRGYRQLVELLAQPDPATAGPAVEPFKGWGAYMLLARAAPLVLDRNRRAALFDPQSMRPRISDPPFVRAMEMVAEVAELVASGSCESVFAAQASLAIGVPPSGGRWAQPRAQKQENVADQPSSDLAAAPVRGSMMAAQIAQAAQIAWSDLPGAEEVFQPLAGRWKNISGSARRATLLGIDGRMAGVATTSRNTASAFRLLAWLCSSGISSQLGPASTATTIFRRSQLSTAGRWFDAGLSRAEVRQLSDVIEEALTRDDALAVPRIPGVDAYLAALQSAVDRVLDGTATPAEALGKAAAKWEDITDRFGRDAQRKAYSRHLNLAE